MSNAQPNIRRSRMGAARSSLSGFGFRTRHSLRMWFPWIALVILTALVVFIVWHFVVMPGYHNRQSRMYTSRLGYVALARRENRPLPVTVCKPQTRLITEYFVGEGFVRSSPILVPIIPASRIQEVFVSEGEEVTAGQTLAKLDTSHAQLRIEAAETMLEVAMAELERTKIGSSYQMEQERPQQDAIRLQAASDQIRIRDELEKMYEGLFAERAISKVDLLDRRLANVQAMAELREAQVSLTQSQRGRDQSIRIATAAVREAELALRQRQLELTDHTIVAPADGIIERRLIQQGEYNQDPGKPAFLLAAGQWFEAYLDQTVIGKIAVGDASRVSLEAFAGVEIPATVSEIHPFVSFRSAGPETTRPIRPSGTGSPEWPSTFSIRVALDETELPVATGLSGLARIQRTREVMAIPNAALLSVTAAKGTVLVADEDRFSRREVVLGGSSDNWIEVRSGLTELEEVIVDGHHDLESEDKILIRRIRTEKRDDQE